MCCAVGLRNVEIIEDEGLVERAAVMGKRLMAGLEELYNLPNVGEVRGLGLMAGVELVADKGGWGRSVRGAAPIQALERLCARNSEGAGKSPGRRVSRSRPGGESRPTRPRSW